MEALVAELHTHSTFSDGALSPTELVEKAASIGIEYLALTDHNSVYGIEEAIEAGNELGVKIIPGVEIRTSQGEILGYFIDTENSSLVMLLKELQGQVDNEARQSIAGLNNLGINITYEEVKEEFQQYPMMDAHIAQIFLKRGLISSPQEFFDKYRPKFKIDINLPNDEEVISVIKKVGGVSVIPHIYLYRDYEETFYNIEKLKKAGLVGIEIRVGHYIEGKHKHIVEEAKDMAERHNLILTKGSDFHGPSYINKLGEHNCSVEMVRELWGNAANARTIYKDFFN